VRAAPAGLAGHVAAALAGGGAVAALATGMAAGAAGASTSAVTLAKGAVIAMTWTKLKIAAAVAVALLLTAGGAVGVVVLNRPPATKTLVLGPATTMPATSPAVDAITYVHLALAGGAGRALVIVNDGSQADRQAFWDAAGRNTAGRTEKLPLDTSVAVTIGADGNARWNSIAGGTRELRGVLEQIVGLKPWEYDPVSVPQLFWIPGDWAVRDGATIEQRMTELGPIVSKQAGRRFHFERQRLPREVVIARGQLGKIKPLWENAEPDVIEFYDAPNPDKIKPVVRHTTLADMLDALQYVLSRPVIIDVPGAADTQITWRNHLYTKDPNLLLRNLIMQTGLCFDREPRDLDQWVLLPDDGGPPPSTTQRTVIRLPVSNPH
jgi:hypothetical protein